jgi:UDP-N-acetylglucosamine 2-epimerase (non-hydrolysing)
MKIMHVVGVRPNFMKIGPLFKEMAKHPQEFQQVLVHTGQHYDLLMSQIFFEELGLPLPEINLEVGSGSHAWQTAHIILRFEGVVLDFLPDWVVVPGDVNSTLACSLVCSKLGVKVAHVEAGLRSFDRTMPEEINRILTDQIADLLFTPSRDADENLRREGLDLKKVFFVGNIMIDTLITLLPHAEKRWPVLQRHWDLDEYLLVTLHRPNNVDNLETFRVIMDALRELANKIKIIFPVHPRTAQLIERIVTKGQNGNLILINPLGYLDFLALESHARLVLTDSGGVQEETTFLGVPCLTLRPNTERPVTVYQGTNRLVENQREKLIYAVNESIERPSAHSSLPELWDGRTAERIVDIFLALRT